MFDLFLFVERETSDGMRLITFSIISDRFLWGKSFARA